MTRAKAALRAVWDFVVGDDWRIALGVVLGLALTAIVAALGLSAWWVMALAVPLVLGLSLRRAAARANATTLREPLPASASPPARRFRRRSRRARA
jgi:hypothetical protein